MICLYAVTDGSVVTVSAGKSETVLISYELRSKLGALKIAYRLKTAGYDVWVDVEQKCTYVLQQLVGVLSR